MNRYAIKIEFDAGRPFATIRNRDNAAPENDEKWTVCWEAPDFLAETHIPPELRRELARTIQRLAFKEDLISVNLYDRSDGWGVYIALYRDLEHHYLSGVGATPAEAIKNARPHRLPWER